MVTKRNQEGIRYKPCRSDLIYYIAAYTILIILFLVILYPLVYVVSASFTEAADVLTGKMVLWPTSFTLAAYKEIFSYKDIWTGFGNSFLYVGVGTLFSLFLTFTAAYPLSRKDFVMKGLIMKIYTVTLFFGGGLVPYFLLVKGLGMYGARLSMIIPSAVSVWNIILVRTYFLYTIPDELLEAAKVDGCGNIRFFFGFALRLSASIIAVMIMYYGVAKWNGYFDALIFLNQKEKYPLQLILRTLLVNSQMNLITGGGIGGNDLIELLDMMEGMKYGVIVVSSIPMVALCIATQKYFQKGIMLGSMKG